MYILGISAYYHDSAACLIKDGEILSAAQEERFTRVKHDHSFPINAVEFCMKTEKISVNDLECIVFYEKTGLKFDRLLKTYLSFAPKGLNSYLKSMSVMIKEKLWLKKDIRRRLGFKGKVISSTHHESHSASAFYPSPFERAAILTMDGVGEWTTTSMK